MDYELSSLIDKGFFKGARKDMIADFLKKKGFDCNVKSDELLLRDKDFSLIISDESSILIGNDSGLKKTIGGIKKKLHAFAKKGICSKKKMLNQCQDYEFISYHFNPLIFQCFYDFKIDFSKISKSLKKKGIRAVYLNDYFSLQSKDAHYSIKLDKNYSLNKIDYSVDFYKLKTDEFFIGYPYSVKFLCEPYTEFAYSGNFDEFKKIASKIIDELSNQF